MVERRICILPAPYCDFQSTAKLWYLKKTSNTTKNKTKKNLPFSNFIKSTYDAFLPLLVLQIDFSNTPRNRNDFMNGSLGLAIILQIYNALIPLFYENGTVHQEKLYLLFHFWLLAKLSQYLIPSFTLCDFPKFSHWLPAISFSSKCLLLLDKIRNRKIFQMDTFQPWLGLLYNWECSLIDSLAHHSGHKIYFKCLTLIMNVASIHHSEQKRWHTTTKRWDHFLSFTNV